jgi:hypothetical protein
MSTMCKILSLTKTTDLVHEEGSHPEEEDPRDSRITTQKTRTSIVSIMGEDTTLKGAQKPRKNMARIQQEKALVSIASSMPSQFRPELLTAAIHELSTKSSPNSAIFTTTIILATISAVFSPVTGNPINPATTANSGNLTTITRQFVKTTSKFRTSEFDSIAIFWDHHANFRRIGHGIRD